MKMLSLVMLTSLFMAVVGCGKPEPVPPPAPVDPAACVCKCGCPDCCCNGKAACDKAAHKPHSS